MAQWTQQFESSSQEHKVRNLYIPRPENLKVKKKTIKELHKDQHELKNRKILKCKSLTKPERQNWKEPEKK